MYFTKEDIQKRRERLAAKWNEILKEDEVVLVYSGMPIQKPGGLDQTYPFISHPYYYWLTARRREGEVIAYNKNLGWTEFQKAFTKDQAVWEGDRNDILLSQPGRDLTQLENYLTTQKFSYTYALGETNHYLPDGKAFMLKTLLDQTRRVKDEAEIKLIKHLASIAAFGYNKIAQVIKPGVSEKEIQIIYESEIYRNGAHNVPYDTIVGSGQNASTLHALPTRKIIQEKELVLIDAGAAIYDYCVDITRTYASSPDMDSRQKALYQLVLKVQEACMQMSKPGVFWRDVHSKAAIMFTEALHELGILKGNVSTLIENEVISLFFPHGLGHLVGLHVRDTGQEENLEPKKYFGARLRVDIQLEQGHLITVEPGLYFIKSLLEDADNINKYKDHINWQELEKWKNAGGVRIEDNILITETGNENLTSAIPKKSVI